MSGLSFMVTDAGRAALVNAPHTGTTAITIAAIGLTDVVFTAKADMTALPGEFTRLTSIAGEVVAADTLHVTIRDDSDATYTVRGMGYWLDNGVLFGLYSQPDPILQKSAQSMLLLSADAVFTTLDVTALTFGDASFTNPPATVDRQGVVELATPAETVAGQDATRAVTPAGLAPAILQAIAAHQAEADPHGGYLTPERGDSRYFHKLAAYTSSDTDCDTLLDTGVRDVSVANDRGILAATRLPLDGDGYGTLTTVNGGQFVRQIYSEGGTTCRTWTRTAYLDNASPFKGRDWKLLWDSGTFDPASKQDQLGFIPVQQGGGIGQLPNTVNIGWAAGDGLKATVDVTDQGYFVFGDQAMRLRWAGQPGQPPWLLGGSSPDDIAVFNPAEFSVKHAASAGGAQTADKINNGVAAMQMQWSDPGGQTLYVWGSDSAGAARLCVTGELRVGHATHAANAGNAATVGNVAMRFQENIGQHPYYVYGVMAGRTEMTLFNRTELAVGFAGTAMYANQLTGPALNSGSVGSYQLSKSKASPGLPGVWEHRGMAYDYGSGAIEGNESSTVLWQRRS